MSAYATIDTIKLGPVEFPETLDPNGIGLVYGRYVALRMDAVDRIAVGLNLEPLSSFSNIPDLDHDEDLSDQWCDPRDGLETVEGLLSICSQNQNADHTLDLLEDEKNALAGDLAVYKAILAKAIDDDDRFRIVVD